MKKIRAVVHGVGGRMNMKMSYLGIGAVIIVVLAFFLWQSSVPKSIAPAEEAMMTAEDLPQQRTVIMLDEQSSLGQSGEAVITANAEGMAVITLNMTGGTFPSAQPAHVHEGRCPSPGKVTHPLTDVVNGTSVTTLEESYDAFMARTEPLAINVHKSSAEASVYTACGNVN